MIKFIRSLRGQGPSPEVSEASEKLHAAVEESKKISAHIATMSEDIRQNVNGMIRTINNDWEHP